MKKVTFRLLLCAVILFALPCFAQSTAISNGTTWLSTNQNADGSWGAQADLAFVYSCDAINALKYLDPSGTDYSEGITWLSTQDATSTDELSRTIISLTNAGQSASELLSALLINKYSDGGWGLQAGDLSDPLDTAFSLQALKAANYSDVTAINGALAYLTLSQNSDGGWGFYRGDSSNTYVTAVVSATLQSFPQVTSIATAVSKATTYLIAHQNADGGFGSSPSTMISWHKD